MNAVRRIGKYELLDELGRGGFADLEIRLFARQERGYPVELTLNGTQEFPRDYLPLDIVPWVPSSDLAADGERLFAALLANVAWGQIRGQTSLCRIRLRIDPDAAALHALPWELLRVNGILLAANATTPFSRYLPKETPWEAGVAIRPLRVLAVLSNPTDLETVYQLSPVKAVVERAWLEQALAGQNVQLDFLQPPVTLARLEAKLRAGYHVLHYVGHGAVGRAPGQPVLYLQKDDGKTALVKGAKFAALLARQGVQPHLVVLAACESATVATNDAYVALGPQLLLNGISAVVAMRGKITQRSAQIFSRALYARLLVHGVVDLAMNEARSMLVTEERLDAAVPVLFMRLKDGRLWQPADAPTTSAKLTTVPDDVTPILQDTNEGASMTSTDNSSPALRMARRVLAILEERAAGFGALHIPVHLQIELEEKRREVAELETRWHGAATAASPAPPEAASSMPTLATLRVRLRRLDSVEIESLCLDHFPVVYDKFARGLQRGEMLNLLLDHCRRNPEEGTRLARLLA